MAAHGHSRQGLSIEAIIGLGATALCLAALAVALAGGGHGHGADTGPAAEALHAASEAVHAAAQLPAFWGLGVAPFAILLLCIAVLPLVPATHHWWEENRSKFMVAMVCAVATLGYLAWSAHQAHGQPLAVAGGAVKHAILDEFIPFIVLLGSLFAVTGGIVIKGDLRATPWTNTMILAAGTGMASFVGTTGASMLLIRFLLKVNSERRRLVHTVVFFIFLVSNIGGTLLPIGDPPLYLGYLKGVPFLWTASLWMEWAFAGGVLLAIYFVWDSIEYKRESKVDIKRDVALAQPLRVEGLRSLPFLVGVVLCVALLDPSRPIPGTSVHPFLYLREGLMVLLAGLAMWATPKALREENEFSWFPIVEVAALFSGIFITMQVPLEVLHAKGASLGVDTPMKFFWVTGALSSVLDNAPTYLVFLQTAETLGPGTGAGTGAAASIPMIPLTDGAVRGDLLAAISLGAVFMGANTYIGNGPNFMVKAIAERSGVRMPSFFGYMAFSMLVLIPVFVVLGWVFLR